jgi:putative oxidoreductase
LQSPFLLVVRLYWGWQFFQTGYGKLTNIAKPIAFFTDLGIPFPTVNAYFVSSLECVGGALLFVGLGSRLLALPLTIDMVVAYVVEPQELRGTSALSAI